MINKYRLTSTTYDREKEEDKVNPIKIYFLSVEGNETEKEYLEEISYNRSKLGINTRVDVEVLKRSSKDTNSAPKQVIELLEEYLSLREYSSQNITIDIPQDFLNKYDADFIRDYLNNPEIIPKRERNEFLTELTKIRYDINYRKYLSKYNNNLDEFGILIDRDIQTHSEINMLECIKYCEEKQYSCYISNPCFEFWLLLHLSEVKEEYKDRIDLIKENRKVSDNHTFVSKEVSNKAGHRKRGLNFSTNYLPNINLAIDRAKEFAYDEEELINEIGCNLWKLIEDMKKFKP